MYSARSIKVDLDQVLYVLFCAYAFSISFELVLEKLFDIDTVLKPFRAISLAIIGVYFIRVLKDGIQLNPKEKNDLFLYLVFAYGILVSCFQVIFNIFNSALFYSDLFLTGLHVLTYFVYKSISISTKQVNEILKYFISGVVVNAAYIFYTFIFRAEFGRQSGFIDNPNYAALGLVAVIAYVLLSSNFGEKLWIKVLRVFLLFFMLYIFIITGSRAGLILFLIVLSLIFIFSTFRRKLFLVFVTVLIGMQLASLGTDYISFGGPMVLINRVNQKITSETEDVRFIIWRGVFRALEDRGYWGMGIGQFKANFTRYYGEESNKLILEIVNRGYYLSPHNDYLAILADYGLPSLLLYFTFLFFAFKKVIRRILYPSEDEDDRFLFRYSFIMLSCLVVYGLSAENFQHQLFWFLLMYSTKSFECVTY